MYRYIRCSFQSNLTKLDDCLAKLYDGKQIEGLTITSAGIHRLDNVAFQLNSGKPATFIEDDVKKVLEYCGFTVIKSGIGYAVYPE